ncbi:MAG: VIT domain-containing protein [Roseiflexaceae bacterium]
MDIPIHATCVATNDQIIPLQSVHVEGDYVGHLSIMTVTQVYQNPIDQALEVQYTFPLPHDATLLDVTIHIRGKEFKSQVLPNYEGQQKYDEAIARGDTTIMIEQKSEYYLLKLGNLPGGEEVKVAYRFGQFVMPHDGRVRIGIPTTIAPQYGNPTDSGIRPDQAPVTDLAVTYPFSALLRLHGIAKSRISVASHIANITMRDTVCHVAINGATMDRDVVVHINEYGNALLSMYAPHAGQHWYANYTHITQNHTHDLGPMHIKLLVDCSGSMGGSSIRQAQEAVMRLLGMLQDGDSIAVTRFGSNVVDVTPGLMKVGPVIRRHMNNWVNTIEANLGGTAIARALEYVLQMPTNNQDCVVIVLTDGDAYGINQVATLARQQEHRVFPLVISYAPADGELKSLADITGGFCETVTPRERIDDAMERTVNKIRFTHKVDTKLDFGDAVIAWKRGKSVRYIGEQGIVWAVTDRHVQPIWHEDDTRIPLEVVTVDESMRHDVVRMIAAQHLNDLVGDYQAEWSQTYGLMSYSTVFVAVAVHASDEKVTDEQLRVKIAQQMAYDSHMADGEVYKMHAPLDLHTHHVVLRTMPTPRSRRGIRQSNSSAELIGSPSPSYSSSPINHIKDEWFDSVDITDTDHTQDASQDSNGFSMYAPALHIELAKHQNDITKLTFASLMQVGFRQEQIDACAIITGYSETQIIQAIVALILPEKEAKKLGIFVNTIPAALIGGLRIVLTS